MPFDESAVNFDPSSHASARARIARCSIIGTDPGFAEVLYFESFSTCLEQEAKETFGADV